MNDEVKTKIHKNVDIKYRDFSKKLLPNVDNILGVRVPILRRIAKEIVKKDPISYLENVKNESFEETMIEGFVIGNLKGEKGFIIKYIDSFLPKINNWSVCDTFCASLKIVNTDLDYFFKYLCKYKNSKEEFTLRFILVMFLNYYIDIKYLFKIFEIIQRIKKDDYYVKMAIAWFLSMSYIKYKKETLNYLNNSNLDDWTYNKTLQKIIESRQISDAEKKVIKGLKR